MSVIQECYYKCRQISGIQLPPLNNPPNRMDTRHTEALFNYIQRKHYLDHPYWRAVAPGATDRELWETLRCEAYVPGERRAKSVWAPAIERPADSAWVPAIAGWVAMSNDGGHNFRREERRRALLYWSFFRVLTENF